MSQDKLLGRWFRKVRFAGETKDRVVRVKHPATEHPVKAYTESGSTGQVRIRCRECGQRAVYSQRLRRYLHVRASSTWHPAR